MDTRIEDKPVIRVGDPVEPGEALPSKDIGRPKLPYRGFLGGFSLSPLNRRRWRNFKANRRGYWSLWIFLALFIVSLFAEFIANDKPIVAYYKGELLFPAIKQLLRHTEMVPEHQAFEVHDALNAVQKVIRSEDLKEGARAFADKRAPRWQGK